MMRERVRRYPVLRGLIFLISGILIGVAAYMAWNLIAGHDAIERALF
jgi:hypothetical protein